MSSKFSKQLKLLFTIIVGVFLSSVFFVLVIGISTSSGPSDDPSETYGLIDIGGIVYVVTHTDGITSVASPTGEIVFETDGDHILIQQQQYKVEIDEEKITIIELPAVGTETNEPITEFEFSGGSFQIFETSDYRLHYFDEMNSFVSEANCQTTLLQFQSWEDYCQVEGQNDPDSDELCSKVKRASDTLRIPDCDLGEILNDIVVYIQGINVLINNGGLISPKKPANESSPLGRPSDRGEETPDYLED